MDLPGYNYMEKLYMIYPWPDNPFTNEGWRRYLRELDVMKKIISHDWIREVIEDIKGDTVDIVDICGGGGIGGVAFAKVLKEEYNVSPRLTVIDLRSDALRVAEEFSARELGFKARIIVYNVLGKIDLGEKYDFTLLWGYSTPHFSPWDLIRVYANIHNLLKPHGLLVFNEMNRLYTIMYLRGYRDVFVEHTGRDKLVLSIHKSIDHRTGYFHRIAYDLVKRESAEMKLYFWDIAGSSALAWIFFTDIDFIPLERPYRGVVLAYKPRRDINPENYLTTQPKILKQNSKPSPYNRSYNITHTL